MKNKLLASCAIITGLFITGCQIPSRTAFYGSGGRTSYNIAVQSTNAQEMLLNLVRMRYFDSPYFLDVSGVTTQYTYKNTSNATLPIPGVDSANPLKLFGELSWQNQPTMQYSPVEGKKFARQIAQPIDLHTIQQMVYAGWNVKRIFRMVIQSFDVSVNAPMETNPNPMAETYYKAFYEATELMRKFQLQGSLDLGIEILSRKKEGDLEIKEEVLQIAFPSDQPDSQRLAELLGGDTKKSGDRYIAKLYVGYQPKGRFGVMTRSVLSSLHYLSQSVRVPKEEVMVGKVNRLPTAPSECTSWCDIMNSLMTIHWSTSRPTNAYISVFYRKKWFYISDNDLDSKKTFALLQHLYNWQSGQEERSQPPILSLPLG